jgi:hypothetical protein
MTADERPREGFSYGLLISVGIGLIIGFLLENLLIGILLSTALAIGFEVARNYL